MKKNKFKFSKNKIFLLVVSLIIILVGLLFTIKSIFAFPLINLRPPIYNFWKDNTKPASVIKTINFPNNVSFQNMSNFNDSSLNIEIREEKALNGNLIINTGGRLFAYEICINGACRGALPSPIVHTELCPTGMSPVYESNYLKGCTD